MWWKPCSKKLCNHFSVPEHAQRTRTVMHNGTYFALSSAILCSLVSILLSIRSISSVSFWIKVSRLSYSSTVYIIVTTVTVVMWPQYDQSEHHAKLTHIFISAHAHLCLGLEVVDHVIKPIQLIWDIIEDLHELWIVGWVLYPTFLPGTVEEGVGSFFAQPLVVFLHLELLLWYNKNIDILNTSMYNTYKHARLGMRNGIGTSGWHHI